MAHTTADERPVVSLDDISVAVLDLYGIEIQKCIVKELDSHKDRNFYIEDCQSGKKFVLKVWSQINVDEEILCRTEFMDYVNSKGFASPASISNRHGSFLAQLQTGNNKYPMGLLAFVPGTCISKFHPLSASTWNEIGNLLGNLHNSVEGFKTKKPLLPGDDIWFMENMRLIPEYAHKLLKLSKKRTDADYSLAVSVVEMFQTTVVPQYSKFTKGYIHHDFHDDNVLLLPNDDGSEKRTPKEKYGILDFSDAVYSYTVFDVGVLMAYSMIAHDSEHLDCVERAGHVLAGYLSTRSLNSAELEALYVCACCRVLQDAVGSEYDAAQQAEPNEYLLHLVEAGWKCLHQVHAMGKADFHASLLAVLNSYNIRVVLPV